MTTKYLCTEIKKGFTITAQRGFPRAKTEVFNFQLLPYKKCLILLC